MGQFSFITQDTNKSIRECFGCKEKQLTTAYLHDNKGNVWEELTYEGYGVFGGKDFFQLFAEMNGAIGLNGELENDRYLGIELYYDNPTYKYLSEYKGNLSDFVNVPVIKKIECTNKELIYPNLTRFKIWEWKNEKPLDCPNQGWA